MAKKLRGDFFFLSANSLKFGSVVFYSKNGWDSSFKNAIKIRKDEIEFYEKIGKKDENDCIIISPTFIEIDEEGKILTLRDKIRINGITIDLKNV